MKAQDGSDKQEESHDSEAESHLDADNADARMLRRGWTTGACATAATKAALNKLLGGDFLDPVGIVLPGGQAPDFALAHEATGKSEAGEWAEAGIIKDAGDDPDVTHGALVIARVQQCHPSKGIRFFAGEGVGMVTKPGLPLAVGEPAINPVPRDMMRQAVNEICGKFGAPTDIDITIFVRDGARLAQKTWNPRLGILGGLSILGTTGIVVPYSCSAWIHSIHRGIDVARALGLEHVVGSTGDRSEKTAMADLGLAKEAYIDMGDFVGGMLKYVKQHQVARVTIAGGFGKMVKLAQGARDLHSGRSQVDMEFLAQHVQTLGGDPDLIVAVQNASSAAHVLTLCTEQNIAIGGKIAKLCAQVGQEIVGRRATQVDSLVINRAGDIVGRS